jgi:sugar phosphate isomerase/epimerase
MLEEIVELGFDQIELGHGIRLPLWEGIERFVREQNGKISSLHNFCPLPVEIFQPAPDCYRCTSNRSDERERAQKLTLRTIDHAIRVGANRVVLHLGNVDMVDATGRLLERIGRGHYLDRKFVRMKIDAVRKRETQNLLTRVIEWLRPIIEHARAAGVTLGLENRIEISTVPSEPEFRALLPECPSDTVGYWHDFGHAQIRDNLRLINHEDWLAEIAPRLVGCHIHDVQFPGRDHQPPFSGMINFPRLLALVPPDVPLVWEMSPRIPREEIRRAMETWRKRFGGVRNRPGGDAANTRNGSAVAADFGSSTSVQGGCSIP